MKFRSMARFFCSAAYCSPQFFILWNVVDRRSEDYFFPILLIIEAVAMIVKYLSLYQFACLEVSYYVLKIYYLMNKL